MVSRNDGYGENLLHRMQTCIDSIVTLAERHEVPTELLLVEWNPPADTTSLEEALEWPDQTTQTAIDILTVPPEIHATLPGSDELPLFEYIGKNVGIRRADGEFVLSTNPDLIYSKTFFSHLASEPLSHESFYRINKYNVDSLVSREMSIDEQLEFCRNHIAAKYTPAGYRERPYSRRLRNIVYSYYTYLQNPWRIVDQFRRLGDGAPRSLYDLHHLAAGDFILMGKEQWETIGGHPEFEYNFNVDSYTIVNAAGNGLTETVFPDEIRAYHQPHDDFHDVRPQGDWDELVEYSRRLLTDEEQLTDTSTTWGLADEEMQRESICSREA
ncbi:hypothetical protein [Natrarchaeobius chitinivorans]|uniref:Glycosyltransferase family 2 protein n=1 Tax=Natrarchaeobius chitinivorans TaxID=1679083 RepID=A0A3N6LQV8_NATCH|nr:hypothetical protein [Natrarchaeobius chitinivorans]RQG92053.1 hypothetical protein EA473_17490 [Natrarchaeobius chitinivorans]